MKFTSLAISSLGIWVFLSAFVHGSWVGIVFGIITALLALVGTFAKSES
jgi:thiamine transporter ThiT